MPIYLYRCQSCGESVEKLQKTSEGPLVTCGACGQASLRKVIAPVAVVFKGSGFHKNDYSTNGKTSKRSEKKPEAGGSTESKTETKSSEPKKSADTKVA